MKKLFIVANWKSNKDSIQAKDWIERFKNYDLRFTNKEVIICPPFTLLSFLKSYIIDNKLPFRFGAQDVSPFDVGAYTGEVNGRQIKEFSDYVLIGHSERRRYFKETNEQIVQKIKSAFKYNLIPIVCISKLEEIPNSKFLIPNSKFLIPNSKFLIAYEPLFTIGSGNPDTPENAQKMAGEIKKELGDIPILYGGSVTPENVRSFTQIPEINGVLVGTESLIAEDFLKIIVNA